MVCMVLCLAASAFSAPALAEPNRALLEASPTAEATSQRGHPTVTLDRLTFPEDFPKRQGWIQYLRLALRREARRADWGAGSKSRIEYRFTVSELRVQRQGRVLRVRCTAYGKLPKGKQAKSHLDYGGDAEQYEEVVGRVLTIVARGVVTRLAELERVRRGEVGPSHVRTPSDSEAE
jgi:hypothetical protein